MFEGMLVLGENLNATRKVKIGGKLLRELEGGRKVYPYESATGEKMSLDLTAACQSPAAQKNGMVGHIAAGIVGREEAFIAALAQRQVAHGADLLDCCVDEISPVSAERVGHMKWLVRTVQKYVRVPLSLDSSDVDVLRGALEVYDGAVGKPLLNSVNLEPARLPVLELAREAGAALLGNASGAAGLPGDAAGRLQNLGELMARMDEYGIPLADRTLDPLLMPIATNPEHGNHFLETCRRMRERYGAEFHLTGGLSNVSFGLPNRRLVNEAMAWLARGAGCDVAFIDPLQVRGFRTGDADFRMAIEALEGRDPYCMNYVMFCRMAGY